MSSESIPTIFIRKDKKDAVLPTKGNDLAIGMDLTIISKEKKLSNNTYLYDTGLQVKPADGYYTEILPRSSLSKSGYMLANSVGVIDPDYRGNLLIALTKTDTTMPDLQLPFKCCQLVLRKACYYNIQEVEALDSTERGAGGFGSTDKDKSLETSPAWIAYIDAEAKREKRMTEDLHNQS